MRHDVVPSLHARVTLCALLALLLALLPAAGPTSARAAPPGLAPQAASPPDLDLVGHLGGVSYAVAAQSSYVYAGFGAELAVLDAGDPSRPARVGYLTLPDTVQQIAVAGHYAYVADESAGLRVVDIADPTAPREVASYPTGAPSRSVAAAGERIYVGDSSSLRIVSVADPAAPAALGSYTLASPEWIERIAVAGDYAYVGALGLVSIVDLSDPAAPTLAGTLSPDGTIAGLAAADGYAYVSDTYSLRVFDVAQPGAPRLAAVVRPGADFFGAVVLGNGRAYVGGGAGLVAIDISRPTDPRVIGTSSAAGYALAVADGHAYLASGGDLRVVDLTSPALRPVGQYAGLESPRRVALAGRYAYVAETSGLRVVDISRPRFPVTIGRLALPGDGISAGVAVAGRYVYYVGGGATMDVVDVASPTAPRLAGSIGGLGFATRVIVSGGYAYVIADAGLHVVSLAIPMQPARVGFYPAHTNKEYADLVVSGEYVFVASKDAGLRVLSVATPANPVEVTTFDTPGYALGVALSGHYVYIADTDSLRVVDIARPAAPAEAASLPAGHAAAAVRSSGKLLFFAGGGAVEALDISSPERPVALGGWTFPDRLIPDDSLAVAGADAYVTEDSAGMFAVRAIRPNLSGTITDAVGRPFAGAVIRVGDGRIAIADQDGKFAFAALPPGEITATPVLGRHVFWPSSQQVDLRDDTGDLNFVALPEPAAAAIAPNRDARLVYTDTLDLPTEVDIPSGAVAAGTTLVLTPTIALSPHGAAFAGHAFELGALGGAAPSEATFAAPVTLTIRYGDDEVRPITDERRLELWRWSGDHWSSAAETCAPASAYARDTAANTVQIAICRAGTFALFGPTYQVFMPIG